MMGREIDFDKVCFVVCVDDVSCFERTCIAGLRRLVVPEGMSVEVLTIDDAPSMTAGYEKARCTSDAKYKVYLHQDVEIINPNFIEGLLSIFSRDKSIGMVGMVGVNRLCSNAVWWDSFSNGLKGGITCTRDEQSKAVLNFCEQTGTGAMPYEAVATVDGLLIATQYDVPWRDDVIGSWHYYDISQCFEYRRQGYQIVVPKQEECWVIHHERDKRTYSWLYDWDSQRRKCLKEYWTEIAQVSSEDEKKIEILITDKSEWEGTDKYDYLRELAVPEGYAFNVTVTKGSWKARDYREFQ